MKRRTTNSRIFMTLFISVGVWMTLTLTLVTGFSPGNRKMKHPFLKIHPEDAFSTSFRHYTSTSKPLSNSNDRIISISQHYGRYRTSLRETASEEDTISTNSEPPSEGESVQGTRSDSKVTNDVPESSLERVGHELGSMVEELLQSNKIPPADSSNINVTSSTNQDLSTEAVIKERPKQTGTFDLTTALFCAGLAFDAYVEPAANSSRWERGSKGMQVAFLSNAFTRQLYRGLVEISLERIKGLPRDENAAERLLSGDGVDACLLVAAVEGTWKEDIELLEKEQYHEGVLDLTGVAHVVRSSTAWASTDQRKSENNRKQRGKALPYHIPHRGWGSKGDEAVWPEDSDPFYLYVQDPKHVRLVFTVMDDNRMGNYIPIGSTWKRLADLIPQASYSREQLFDELKGELLEQVKEGGLDVLEDNNKIRLGAKTWMGDIKLTSKPRKKNKNSQILAGAAAGAWVAGPAGAAVGALAGSFYEGQVQGSIQARIRYLPIPDIEVARKKYEVKGGMEGILWGRLFETYSERSPAKLQQDSGLHMDDLEHCFFINHEETGATCVVYRSVQQKLIVVSFRGTCAPIDLITDANIAQDAWVEGDDIEEQDIPKVHSGFRSSLDSISRRLKELLLATVTPGESIADYDLLVTGHSLGGALATLFTADIGQYGIDAGRGLPQLEESDPWWKAVASTFMGQQATENESVAEPPKPKSLRVYSFGSPRVGNIAFSDLFDALVGEGKIDQAYRIVNGEDVVARLPRSVNAFVFGQVNYEHCGATVLVTQPSNATEATPLVWVEGESDNNKCPVRDGVALTSPMAEGNILSELYSTTQEAFVEEASLSWDKISSTASKLTERLRTLTPTDVASILGIEKSFTEREMKIVQSLFQGKALAHHMEDEYYAAIGRATGCEDMVVIEVST